MPLSLFEYRVVESRTKVCVCNSCCSLQRFTVYFALRVVLRVPALIKSPTVNRNVD